MKLLMRLWLAAILLALPVHAAEINDFDPVDANNIARWPEGMTFANVNNSARADEGIVARFFRDVNGSLTTTGAANAYSIAANQTFTAYYTGMWVKAKANHTNTGASTLNVDGLGVKTVSNAGVAGIVSGRIYDWVYDGTNFQVLGQAAEIPTGTKIVFFQAACPSGWTKDVANNDKGLRVVSGTGGGTGGSVAFTTAFASKSVTGTTDGTAITEAQMPSHTHGASFSLSASTTTTSGGFSDFIRPSSTPGATQATGGGATHAHTFTGNAINLAVQYLDVIICSRD
jgi:hypothetical protein